MPEHNGEQGEGCRICAKRTGFAAKDMRSSKRSETPTGVLKDTFGYDSFRKGQAEIIREILAGRDVLGIMPTGAGKSLCYQIPAILGGGISMVVSPLISLMKDQVDALVQNGVRAAAINSSVAWEDVLSIFARARQRRCSLLYIAPERLENVGFRNFLRSLDLRLLVVDEAHCVSHWGHDFRPSYLNIAPTIASLERRPVVAAFTATATPEVQNDIVRMLGLTSPFVLTTGFDRANLFFQVEHPKDKNRFLLEYVKKFPDMSGIVYCSTRKTVEDVCEILRKNGGLSVRYHAGLSERERTQSQNDFTYDRANVMVATNAFGMGIDKSNVRYVIHYNMPKDMDSYYQEAGRAGRDGSPSDCILLFARRDIATARFLISKNEDPDTRQSSYGKLQTMVDYCHTSGCLRSFILRYFGDNGFDDGCESCGNCTSVAERIDVTIEAKKILSCVFRMGERTDGGRFGLNVLVDVLRGSKRAYVRSLGLDKISTWGLMKGYLDRDVRDMTNFLVAENYLRFDEGDHPTLSFTDRTFPFLGSKSTRLLMRRYEKKPGKKAPTRAHEDTSHEALFEILRDLRKTLADEENVPPYIVFSDHTLYAMCQRLPSDEEEFLAVPGVGRIKLEKYGSSFLEAIRTRKKPLNPKFR